MGEFVYVELNKYVEKMEFENLTPGLDISGIKLTHTDINRPALQLTGFYDHFDSERVQVIGNVEFAYLKSLTSIERWDCFETLCASSIPCIVFARNLRPDEEMIQRAAQNNCPVFLSSMFTSDLIAESVRWLKVQMAPMISIHGVLVDVYGQGVLIMGESGIGKSEAALELIRRGHRLVSDDVVEIRKVSDETLVGSAPEITRHFIELRGIGIVDVKTL
ncbi:MAG: HPr(Ser) kinase/phosphatase, partial [Lachnospiraceae bacterium]|nr:HPr(Ser) kinase/phosphatase [Lachnospiraceae bacterium]